MYRYLCTYINKYICADQFESSTSPPRAFELLKIGLFKFPPLGAKRPFKCPTNLYWNTSPPSQLRLQSNTLHVFQREICRNNTFKLLLKTHLKELFTNQSEILSCKSVKPCTNRKNSRRITSEQEINPVQIPHPFNTTFKFPPPRARCTVKCPGYARGGDVEVSNSSAQYTRTHDSTRAHSPSWWSY